MLFGWGLLILCDHLAVSARLPDTKPQLLLLSDVVRETLKSNERMADARDTVEQADLGRRLARSAFHPKLVPNILGSFGQTDVPNQTYRMDVTQKLPLGTELRVGVGATTAQDLQGRYYSADSTLQISQPLLRGFGTGVAKRQLTAAQARLTEARRQQTLTEQRLVIDVATAYYGLIARERLAGAAEKSLARARSLLEASQAKLEIGKVSQLDVYRAQQLVAQAEGQFLDARAAADDTRDLIRSLMRRPDEPGFEVATEIPRAEEALPAPEEAVTVALEQRLELKSASEAIVEAERSASFAKNQLLPQVDVNLALTRREAVTTLAGSFGLRGYQFATFFAISMPVDRTPQIIEYQNSLIDRDRRRRELATLKTRISDEARRAVRQNERLSKGLDVSHASLEFAQKELEVAQLRYERGLSNNLDVVNAEASVLVAEARHLQTLADQAVTRLSLRATLGLLDPRKDFGVETEARE
jgi:outer membrane protein